MSNERQVPDVLIPSIAVATEAERARLEDQTAIERDWYQIDTRYPTNQAILEAGQRQQLVQVSGDTNLAPIGRLRNEQFRSRFPPFTNYNTLAGMRKLGLLWRGELAQAGLPEDETERIRLAITSLTRSEATQARLVQDPTKLAAKVSSHCAAGAFDIDASGYYAANGDGSLVSVPHLDRDREAVAKISQTLQAADSEPYEMPVSDLPYRPVVAQALISVSDRLHEAGVINRIVEFADTPNQCVHVAVNPHLDGYDWARL